jgi:hypothetical protein
VGTLGAGSAPEQAQRRGQSTTTVSGFANCYGNNSGALNLLRSAAGAQDGAMKMDVERATMELDRLQILKLRGARGVRLLCQSGSLWVTQEGVARDDFLVPGTEQEVETDGVVVVEAMMPSSLAIDSRARPQAMLAA